MRSPVLTPRNRRWWLSAAPRAAKIEKKIRSFITRLKRSRTQRRIYDEVTVASAVLLDEQRAASEIVRCVEACLRQKRPVYIEVPHDIVDREIPITGLPLAAPEKSDPHTLEAALQETLSLIRAARKPVILAGVELARYRMARLVVR